MLVGLSVICHAEEAPMVECREGDSNCYLTVGHRLFSEEKKYAEAIQWFTKVFFHFAQIAPTGNSQGMMAAADPGDLIARLEMTRRRSTPSPSPTRRARASPKISPWLPRSTAKRRRKATPLHSSTSATATRAASGLRRIKRRPSSGLRRQPTSHTPRRCTTSGSGKHQNLPSHAACCWVIAHDCGGLLAGSTRVAVWRRTRWSR